LAVELLLPIPEPLAEPLVLGELPVEPLPPDELVLPMPDELLPMPDEPEPEPEDAVLSFGWPVA
jgi:hypothetical protein